MSDILKEAIADAKAVRETALANAKMALEEAFTPQLKSMLSAKLREDEFEDEEEVDAIDIGDDEEEISFDEPVEEQDDAYDKKIGKTDASHLAEEDDEEGGEDEVEIEEGEDEENPFAGEEEEDELDLESIIRELETEISEQDDAYDETDPGEQPEHVGDENTGVGGTSMLKSEGEGEDDEEGDEEYEVDESVFNEQDKDEDEDEDEDEIDENNDVSSGIGSGDNSKPAANANKASTEDPSNSTDVEDMDGVTALKGESYKRISTELKEYKEAVIFLKDKLHEVNILNAKLLFTNKLFKEYTLDNNQKLKVVETFDRTQSTREIKLVYSTLAEQFADNSSTPRKNPIRESASSRSGSTRPSQRSRKVITEEDQVAARFKKLAGLL